MTHRDEGSFLSVTGQELKYRIWRPEGTPRGIVQMIHGMAEHIGRYDEAGEALADAGYLAAGHNQIGHGPETPLRGYFGKRDGWRNLLEDIHRMRGVLEGRYAGIPLFLLGHSMGSFEAQAYVAARGKGLAGCVLSGTGYYSRATAQSGIQVARMEIGRGREKKASPLIDRMGFQTANRPFAPNRTKYDWLSRDEEEVDRYVADEHCGFLFTAAGYMAFFQGLQGLTEPGAAKGIPPELPILIIAGERDPIGQMGKGVRRVAGELLRAGQRDLSVRLYPECRHELFHELNRREVFRDLTAWLDMKTG